MKDIRNSTALLPFLPMLYIAWADEILSPSEILLIKDTVNQNKELTEAERSIINNWLDPQNPPSARELQFWLQSIRFYAKEINSEKINSLASLGLEMAKVASGKNEDAYTNLISEKALCHLEKALGLEGCNLADDLLAGKRPEAKPFNSEVGFDIGLMQQFFDRDQPELKKKLKQLLKDPIFAKEIPETKAEYRELVLEWCQLLADQGLGGFPYPKEHGGSDDMAKYVAVFEMLGYLNLSLVVKFGVQFGLFGGSILWLGTEKHHKKYLKDISTLSLPGCFAMTESNHGSNVRDIETTATYDPNTEEFIINTPGESARKEYIGNAAVHGQLATVFTQLKTNGLDFGVHAIVVPIRDKNGNTCKGVKIGDNGLKLGLNGVDNGRLWFDNVRVPRENLLDKFAQVSSDGEYTSDIASESRRFFTMLGTLVGGRVCVPIAGLSSAKLGLAIAIKYATTRRQFGPPHKAETIILDYPSHQRRLLPYLAKTYALDFAHKYMVERFVNRTESEMRELEAIAAGLKAVSTWHTTSLLQECREACGGNGYLAENRFADLKADSDIFTTFEGDNVVLLQLVAKGRLTQFNQEFRQMNAFKLVKFFTNIATDAITDRNPISIRNTQESHLLDPDFHLEAFKYREERLVMSAGRRLKHRLAKEGDNYEALLEVQNHLITMAKAYIERIILEEFQNGIKKVEDEGLKNVLIDLANLYALHEIEKNAAWYLEQDYLEGVKSKAIRKMIDSLCQKIKPNALSLVDGFGIPKELVNAPITQD